MAPFFPSWLGNGTSRRAAFIGGGVPGLPGMVAGLFIVCALLEELDERKAALPARKGIRAVAGLAVQKLAAGDGSFVAAPTHLAEPLRPRTVLSTACWRRVGRSVSGGRVEWRGGRGVAWRSGRAVAMKSMIVSRQAPISYCFRRLLIGRPLTVLLTIAFSVYPGEPASPNP